MKHIFISSVQKIRCHPLMALCEVDYGLMGVVGGLTAFIGFSFGILSGAVGRFYAFALGRASVANDPQQGLEGCREWFSLEVQKLHHKGDLSFRPVCERIAA